MGLLRRRDHQPQTARFSILYRIDLGGTCADHRPAGSVDCVSVSSIGSILVGRLGVADGLFGFPDGSGWHPLTYITANKYTVARLDGAWVPLAQAWGTVWRWGNGSTNYAEIDGNGSVTLTGTARISPRYNSETQNSSASWNITKPITFANSTSTGAMTASLPDATTVTGTPYTVVKIDASANAVNVTPYGAQTINGSASAYAITARWQTATFFSNGSNWVIIWT